MSLVDWLAQPAGRVLTLALLHFLWQGLLVAVSLAVLVKLCRIQRTSTRYACSLTALVAMAAMPIATLAWLALNLGDAPGYQPLTAADPTGRFIVLAKPVDEVLLESRPPMVDSLQPYALAAWFGGVMVFGSRLVAGAVGVHQLRRSRLPIPAELRARVERLGRRLQMDAVPLVFLSKDITDAMALGLVRRLVLVPAAWATAMPLDMLEAVIAHELAHLRRMDLWATFLQRVMETLFFYHPAVWWLSRRLGIERELCSDELAVAATGERLVYAQTLEHIAAKRQTDIRPALAAYLQGESNMRLLQRIRNVLAPSAGETGHWPAGLVALGLAVCLWMLSISVLGSLTPSAHADEPSQEEANADDVEGDDAREDASDESSESVEVQLEFESDADGESDDVPENEASGIPEVEIEFEEEEEESQGIEEEVEVEIDADLESLEDKIKQQVAEALKQALAQIEVQKSKKLDKAKPMLAEKVKKAQLRAERIAPEVHKKALRESAEQIEKARLRAAQAAAEAHKVAIQGKKARAEAEQMAAEAHKKGLLQREKQLENARMMDELKMAHMRLQEEAKQQEQRHKEELKMAHMRLADEARLQEERHKEQLHHVQLEREALDKAAFQRANDQRFEELAVMVKELSMRVEMLHKELNSLRKGEDAKAGEKEGKDDAKELLNKLLGLESSKEDDDVKILPRE
jgi:beta-lactamase regulating signal transducer with metallopeptidase domain